MDITKNDLCNVPHFKGKQPYGNYDTFGRLIGYFWYYGETVSLKFTIEGEITTDKVDELGNPIYVLPEDFLQDKQAQIKLYNFRYEEVYSWERQASTSIDIEIDKETSKKIIRGDYYLTLQIVDELALVYLPLIKDKECIITVR